MMKNEIMNSTLRINPLGIMKLKSIISGALVVLLVASCTKTVDEPASETYLTFYSGSPSFTKAVNLPLNQAQLKKGQEVGLYIFPKNSNLISTINKKLIVSDNNVLEPDVPLVRPEGPLEILAYYPYYPEIKSYSDTKRLLMGSFQLTEEAFQTYDIMFGEPVVNPIGPNETKVAIKFVHKMSRIDMKFTPGVGVDLRGAQVKIRNVEVEAIINPRYQEITLTGGAKGLDILIADFGQTETNFNANGIIFPQKVAKGKIFFEIRLLSGKVFSYELSSDQTFASGKRYTYNVSISLETMIVNSSIKDWKSGSSISGEAN